MFYSVKEKYIYEIKEIVFYHNIKIKTEFLLLN